MSTLISLNDTHLYIYIPLCPINQCTVAAAVSVLFSSYKYVYIYIPTEEKTATYMLHFL